MAVLREVAEGDQSRVRELAERCRELLVGLEAPGYRKVLMTAHHTAPRGDLSGLGSPVECMEQPGARRGRPRRPGGAELWRCGEGGPCGEAEAWEAEVLRQRSSPLFQHATARVAGEQ